MKYEMAKEVKEVKEVKELKELTTGVQEVDWLIFDQLTDKDLLALCQVSKKMSELCKNEKFWEHRAKSRFSQQSTQTWKEKYISMATTAAKAKKHIDFRYYGKVAQPPKKLVLPIGKLAAVSSRRRQNSVQKGDIVEIYYKFPKWRTVVTSVSPSTITSVSPSTVTVDLIEQLR